MSRSNKTHKKKLEVYYSARPANHSMHVVNY